MKTKTESTDLGATLCEGVDGWGLPVHLKEGSSEIQAGGELKAPILNAGQKNMTGALHTATDPDEKAKMVAAMADKLKTKDSAPVHVEAGSALAKPTSEIGTEHGQTAASDSIVKPDAITKGDGVGEPTGGAGVKKDKAGEAATPASVIKVGKPGDDHGKHVGESVQKSEDASHLMAKRHEAKKAAMEAYKARKAAKVAGKPAEHAELGKQTMAPAAVHKDAASAPAAAPKAEAAKKALPKWVKKPSAKAQA